MTNAKAAADRQVAFIDESGSPFFDPTRPEAGYVVVCTLMPEHELVAARALVPRDENGDLVKSSGAGASDQRAAGFIGALFAATRTRIGLITVALSDAGNQSRMKRMKTGIDRSPFPRRSRPSDADAFRIQAALAAFGLSLVGLPTQSTRHRIQLVFDRGSERPGFMKKAREFLGSYQLGPNMVIDDAQWHSRDEEPLIMASDWIAGCVRRDAIKGDLPLTRGTMSAAKREGRLHDQEGFTAYLPKDSLPAHSSLEPNT
jgi:hypothetical protein